MTDQYIENKKFFGRCEVYKDFDFSTLVHMIERETWIQFFKNANFNGEAHYNIGDAYRFEIADPAPVLQPAICYQVFFTYTVADAVTGAWKYRFLYAPNCWKVGGINIDRQCSVLAASFYKSTRWKRDILSLVGVGPEQKPVTVFHEGLSKPKRRFSLCRK